MLEIYSYGLVSAAGSRSADLWNALMEGRDCSQAAPTGEALGRVCLWPSRPNETKSWGAQAERVFPRVAEAFAELQAGVGPELRARLKSARVGLLLASTKGLVDDFVWSQDREVAHQYDAFLPLEEEIERHFRHGFGQSFARSLPISTACTSSLSALSWAERWLDTDLDFVLVAAVDAVGPFVFRGFATLKSLTPTQHQPFAAERSGLQLGEAAALLLVGRDDLFPSRARLLGVELDAEGHAVTRPSSDGMSLARALERLPPLPPDAVIAHGTATQLNDQAEDRALRHFFERRRFASAPVTTSKWSVGHTLGASGLVDTILACEALHAQRLFRIGNTARAQSTFAGNYYCRESKAVIAPMDRILVTSLGFGGVHAAALIESPRPANSKIAAPRPAIPARIRAFRTLSREIEIPLTNEPTWATRVERWNQLDPYALSLCEAYALWAEQGLLATEASPALQIFASPFASNETDLAFVASGCQSPSKFVHTLPNIRASPLLQLMGWTGPIQCFAPSSRVLETAQAEVERSEVMPVWIWSVRHVRANCFRVELSRGSFA